MNVQELMDVLKRCDPRLEVLIEGEPNRDEDGDIIGKSNVQWISRCYMVAASPRKVVLSAHPI